ncbi:MAG: hypothetical protein ACYTDY_03075 [Planctomycetota bacterium]
MAGEDTSRVKFCRYCDGVVPYDAESCPHCDKVLKVESFDEMEFVGEAGPPPKRKGLRDNAPTLPPRRGKPPAATPIDDPPVVAPVDDPPIVAPVEDAPPVVRPVEEAPPVVKPLAPKGPVRRGGAGQGKPPVAKPIGGAPPVVPPIEEEVPLVQPLDGDDLPPAVSPVMDCPVCEAEIDDPADIGGECDTCGATMCIACLMRANGIRVSASSETNAERWDAHRSRSRPTQIRCAACGLRGVREA